MPSRSAIDKPTELAETRRRIGWRKALDRFFALEGLVVMAAALVVLALLVGQLALDGAGRVSWQFVTSFPSRTTRALPIGTTWSSSSGISNDRP